MVGASDEQMLDLHKGRPIYDYRSLLGLQMEMIRTRSSVGMDYRMIPVYYTYSEMYFNGATRQNVEWSKMFKVETFPFPKVEPTEAEMQRKWDEEMNAWSISDECSAFHGLNLDEALSHSVCPVGKIICFRLGSLESNDGCAKHIAVKAIAEVVTRKVGHMIIYFQDPHYLEVDKEIIKKNISMENLSVKFLLEPQGFMDCDGSTLVIMFNPQAPFRQIIENYTSDKEDSSPCAIICAPWDVRKPLDGPGDESSYRIVEWLGAENIMKIPFTGPESSWGQTTLHIETPEG
jgi:hypothetical protein